jgi:hypothetical protein
MLRSQRQFVIRTEGSLTQDPAVLSGMIGGIVMTPDGVIGGHFALNKVLKWQVEVELIRCHMTFREIL